VLSTLFATRLESKEDAASGERVVVTGSSVFVSPSVTISVTVTVIVSSVVEVSQSLSSSSVVPWTPQAAKIDKASASLVHDICVPFDDTDGKAKHCSSVLHFWVLQVPFASQRARAPSIHAVSPDLQQSVTFRDSNSEFNFCASSAFLRSKLLSRPLGAPVDIWSNTRVIIVSVKNLSIVSKAKDVQRRRSSRIVKSKFRESRWPAPTGFGESGETESVDIVLMLVYFSFIIDSVDHA